MLLKYELSNFLSFKNNQTINLAFSGNKQSIFKKNTLMNIPVANRNFKKVMKSVAIFGANASGKSNIIKSILFLKEIMQESVLIKNNNSNNIEYTDRIYDKNCFAFSNNGEPIKILLEYFKEINGKRYIFNYELEVTRENKISEIFKYREVKKQTTSIETIVFKKLIDEIVNYPDSLGKIFKKLEISNIGNRSLLSKLINDINRSYFKTEVADISFLMIENLYDFIINDLVIFQKLPTHQLGRKLANNDKFKEKVLDELKRIDINIQDFTIQNVADILIEAINKDNNLVENSDSFVKKLQKDGYYDIDTIHIVNKKNFKLSYESESVGTKTFINILIYLLDVLENGKVLIIDELEGNLHFLIQKYILDMVINSNKGQLIFTTHNVDLLSSDYFSKEQILIVEKNREKQSTFMYGLNEFTELSYKNHNWKNLYLDDRFGGIPEVFND